MSTLGGMTEADKARTLAHYSELAKMAQTSRQKEAHVSIGDWGFTPVRYSTGNLDGLTIDAISLGGAWCCPHDVMLPHVIKAMQNELTASLTEDADHEKTLDSMRGAL